MKQELTLDFSEYLLFYNVENFFLPPDYPIKVQYKPRSGLYNWDMKKYDRKIGKFSKFFSNLFNDFDQLPFIVGLAEISNSSILKDIIKEDIFQGSFSYVHYDSMDERGIDTALLYDTRKLKLISSEVISFFFEKNENEFNKFDTTRDILYCRFGYGKIILEIYILHLPSQKEKNINEPKRKFILDKLNKRIEEDLRKNPHQNIIVMGDFNENPDEKNIIDFVKGHNFELVNPSKELFADKNFSTFHMGDGLLFDQMIFSPSFFSENNDVRFQKSGVYNAVFLREKSYSYRNQPYRTYAGTRYLGGYSDHFPIYSQLCFRIS